MATKNNSILFYSRLKPAPFSKEKIGSPIIKEYGAKLDKNNNVVVDVVRKYDIREYIQSFAKEADIYYLLQKFQNGDTTALGDLTKNSYGDISEMPQSMIDFTTTLQKLQGQFSLLSPDFKKQYNINNVKDYLNALASGVFFQGQQTKETLKEDTSNDTIEKGEK